MNSFLLFFVYNKVGDKMKYIKKHKEVILLVLISSLVMIWVMGDTHLLGHDTRFHLANIENLKNSISWNNLFPTDAIVSNLSFDMGYGLYLFYPIMPHLLVAYLAKFLSFFTVDTYTSLSIFYIFIMIASVLLIYQLSKKLSKNCLVAFFSGLIFLLMPYRIGTMAVRGSLNESMISLFVPMILLSILAWKEKNWKNFYLLFIVGWIGLLWSHMTMALYTVIFVLPFLYYMKDELKDKIALKHGILAILAVTVVVIPGIVQTFSQSGYLVFYDGYMTRLSLLEENFLSWKDYLFMNTNYDWTVPYFIPIALLLSLIVSFYTYLKQKKDTYLTILWIWIPVFILMMSSFFPWEILPKSLWMIQFPWRLLGLLSIVIALLTPLMLQNKKLNKLFLLFFVVLFIQMIPFLQMLKDRPYHIDKIDIDDGRGNIVEYYPEEYLEYPSFFEIDDQSISIVDGDAVVEILSNRTHDLKIKVKTDDIVTLELPKIYYNGYVIEDESNHKEYVGRSKHGRIEVTIKKSGTYHIYYRDLPIVTTLKIVRIIACIGIALGVISHYKKLLYVKK